MAEGPSARRRLYSFLIKKKVKDSKGKETEVVALYEPHPYAFREYSKELEEKIRAEIKN